MGASLRELREEDFDEQVLRRPGLTLVDFWADWCAPCKQLSRLLDTLAEELPATVLVARVNVDRARGLVDRYGVRGIPLLLFFKDGEMIEKRAGVDRRQVLKKAIQAQLDSDDLAEGAV